MENETFTLCPYCREVVDPTDPNATYAYPGPTRVEPLAGEGSPLHVVDGAVLEHDLTRRSGGAVAEVALADEPITADREYAAASGVVCCISQSIRKVDRTMYKLTTNHAYSDMPEIAPTRTELLLFAAVLAAAPLVLLGLVVSGLVT